MNRPNRARAAALALLLLLPLTGCIGGAIQAAKTAKDLGDRASSLDQAQAGDAEAQYKLGESWCCALGGREIPVAEAVYDNETATEWLCKAARQNYGPAQLELARLYSGRRDRGGLKLKLAGAIAPAPTNIAVALMWARLATQSKAEGAPKLLAEIAAAAKPGETAEAERLAAAWQTAPCTWREAIPAS